MKRIVLGYSGGLDTSVAIPWLAERFKTEVVAVVLDLGQGPTLVEVRERALAAGAVRCHVLDVREEFVRDFMLPVLRAGALDEGCYPTGRVLSHSLIAKKLVQIAKMERAATIAHGCTKAEDLRRFAELTASLDQSVDVVAPASIWKMSAADRVDYAGARGIHLSATSTNTHSTIWGRSNECKTTDQAEDAYTLTCAPEVCPDDPAYMDLEFEAGIPTSANGIHMPLVELVESLELIAGAHGVGRIALAGGLICEAPAAVVLSTAYAELSARREEMDTRGLTGAVRVKLEKGRCTVDALQYPATEVS